MISAGFVISGALLLATSRAVARQLADGAAERFWMFIAASLLQLGAVSLVLSCMGRFEPGSFLLLQVVLFGVVAAWTGSRHRCNAAGFSPEPPLRLDAVSGAMLLAMGALALVTLAQIAVMPISGHDERMYHASRAAYWIQHRSIFPFDTHNDRQTVFPFLAELVLAWPMMFTRSELPARLVFWLAYPLSAAGVFLLARQVRVPRRAALGAALLYMSTPTVIMAAWGQKADAWLPLLVVGSAWFGVRALGNPAAGASRWSRAGLLLACAISVKTTALALGAGMAATAVSYIWRPRRMAVACAALGIGACAGLVLSGFVALVVWNIRDYGAPLGPPELSRVVKAELSKEQIEAHVLRTLLFLIDAPDLPQNVMRWQAEQLRRLASVTGADRTLSGEERGWPGPFQLRPAVPGSAFSLGGLVWLPFMAVAMLRLGRESWRRRRQPRLSPVTALLIIQIPLLLGVVFAIRWMPGGPHRFWLPAYALAVPVMVYFVMLWSRRTRVVTAIAVVALVWSVYPSLRVRLSMLDHVLANGVPRAMMEGPYHEAVKQLGPGSRVLLFAAQGAMDYTLFRPHDGYPVVVIPWGKSEFDPERFGRALEMHDVTHVFFEIDHAVGFHWAGALATHRFVRMLESEGEFVRVDGVSAPMALFERRRPERLAEHAEGVEPTATMAMDEEPERAP